MHFVSVANQCPPHCNHLVCYKLHGDFVKLSAILDLSIIRSRSKSIQFGSLVLLDEALCCRFPDLSLSGAAGWLWGENRTNAGLNVAVAMTVTGPNMKAGWRAAGWVCGSLGVWSTCRVWKMSLRNTERQMLFKISIMETVKVLLTLLLTQFAIIDLIVV